MTRRFADISRPRPARRCIVTDLPAWLAVFGLASAVVAFMLLMLPAHAGGWTSFDRYEHRTGRCAAAGMREVAVSIYRCGGQSLSSGQRCRDGAHAAASNRGGWRAGETVRLWNPRNGRRSYAVINDTLPRGRAWRSGVRLDLMTAVARELGIDHSRWMCAR